MVRLLGVSAVALVMSMGAAWAAPHPCAADATEKAAALLKLHMSDVEMEGSIADTVTPIAPIKALAGNGTFDVLELTGYVYKAEYRIRMIYAVLSDNTCLLMGQEILEVADPF